MSAILLGTLACAERVPGADGGAETGSDDETGTDTNDDTNNDDDNDDGPDAECLDDSDCPENWVCISQQWCEPVDFEPCGCSLGKVCIDEQCVPIPALPSCGSLEVTSTETFMLPGEAGDIALAELDGDPGLEVIGVSPSKAIAWIDGTPVESTLALAEGNQLEVAALRANQDGLVDLIVTVPPAHRLYQLTGDGAGGFVFDFERNYGGHWVSDLARLRTGTEVDGMALELLDGGQQQLLYFDVLTNNLPHQVIETYLARAVVDLDGDGVDELVVHNDGLAALWRFDGEQFAQVAVFQTSFELPSKDPWAEPASCDGFAAGDLDGDGDSDLVCMIRGYGGSTEFGALVPFYQTGADTFDPGKPVVVESSGSLLSFFDLEGDGTPELLLSEAVVDIEPAGSFTCASPHALGFGEVGNVDADPADEVVSWGAPQAPFIHDLSW